MIAVALPSIGRDIGAEASSLTQWLVSSYLITSIALQSPGGKLGDLIGHGRALVVGLSLVATGGVLGLLVGDVHALGVARILMASGGAATVPATMAILRNQTAADRRARVFGLFGACMGLAAAIGPLVGGELTERFGWRAVFAANLPVIAVSLLLVLMSQRHVQRRRRPTGRLSTGQAARCSPSASRSSSLRSRMSGSAAWWLGASGAVLLIVFPLWERRIASPVVDFSLFTRRRLLRRRLHHRAAEHGDVPAALSAAGLLRPGPPLGRAYDGPGAAGADRGHDGQLGGGRAAGRAHRRAGADADRLPRRARGSLVVRGFRIRPHAVRRHARHAVDRRRRRHDVAARASRVDEHGRARAGRDGWRRGLDACATSAAWRARRRSACCSAIRPVPHRISVRCSSTRGRSLSRRPCHSCCRVGRRGRKRDVVSSFSRT